MGLIPSTARELSSTLPTPHGPTIRSIITEDLPGWLFSTILPALVQGSLSLAPISTEQKIELLKQIWYQVTRWWKPSNGFAHAGFLTLYITRKALESLLQPPSRHTQLECLFPLATAAVPLPASRPLPLLIPLPKTLLTLTWFSPHVIQFFAQIPSPWKGSLTPQPITSVQQHLLCTHSCPC